MKRIGLFITFVALLILVLPPLTAQQDGKKKAADKDKTEKKADADKDDKKDPEKKDDKKDPEKKDDKKDPEKKDDKKDPEKKDDEKKKPDPKKAPEKLVYGQKLVAKILSANPGSNREYTIELQEVDPKKVFEVQTWKTERMQTLGRQQLEIANEKDPKQRYNRMQNYKKEMYNYQVELAKRQTNIYSAKPMDVRAAETVKVRAMVPPIEFDDQGFEKVWKKKELDERRDKTGLPGFPVDLDALKTGQHVEVYMAKLAPAKAPAKKKNPDDDPPPEADRPEFVMIVILPEWKK